MTSGSRHHSIKEEFDSLPSLLPKGSIETCSKQLISVIIARTSYRKLRLRIQFPDEYPADPLLLELASDTLPIPVIKRMTKQADKKAKELAQEKQYQVASVIEMIKQAIDENKFLYAFEEVKYIQQTMEKYGKCTMNDKKGIIRVDIEIKKYKFRVTFTLDDDYPVSPIQIKAGATNFHEHLVYMHVSQAQEVVRHCTLGYTVEQALMASNPVPKGPIEKKKARGPRITNNHLQNLKGDVRFLKKATDLRQVNTKKAEGRSGFANTTAVRRSARRELKTLSKEELQKESQQEALAKQMDDFEIGAVSTSGDSCTKSLKATFDFLLHSFVIRLSTEPCQVCGKEILPSDPAEASSTIQSQHKMRPERVYCGHWYHWGCLDEWMRNPPFGKKCPVCNIRLYHPDWSSDIKSLERAWANKKTKEREVGEVADCFNLDDEFKI